MSVSSGANGARPRAVVIDYGAGNLHSIARAMQRAGLAPEVTADPLAATDADLLVLPGQGRFGQVARAFAASGFEPLVRDHIAAGRPFLGVCVGLQLLLERSEEDPDVPGLGIVPGEVRRFSGAVRVPQMGWNSITKLGSPTLFNGVPDGAYVYFANSYYALPRGVGASAPGTTTSYGATEFRSAFSLGNLHATQFHPEKSQAVGLRVLENLRRSLVVGGAA
ncbi:MAG TPA: imidazole glycerol phosphate synthase subunit HisH [Trueperaceae bacterium]|nr:imidazole glycerol phosphate synthase subunit HisH [Trueperaceae bacterium]